MTDPLSCSIAETPAERDEVFRLRYLCYRRDGAIPFRPDCRFSDAFDEMPNQFSVYTGDWAEPSATVRISVVRPDLDWTESPAGRVYGDHPCYRAVAATSFVEATRLCFGRPARRDAFMRLVAYLAAAGEFYDVEWMLACPRLEHARVYQRLFGFRPLAEPRRSDGAGFQTRLLGVRAGDLREHVYDSRVMSAAWSEALERLLQSLPAGSHEGMLISASSGK